MVIEATLAQTGQHFITSYLTDRDSLPGFREGMENVAADEQRHIGFGVKLLADLREMDPEVPHAVSDLLREILPATVSVIIPPGWDERYITVFGSTFEELAEAGRDLDPEQVARRRHAAGRSARARRRSPWTARRASAQCAPSGC